VPRAITHHLAAAARWAPGGRGLCRRARGRRGGAALLRAV